MRWIKRWRRRLRAVAQRDAVERELDHELAFHVEMETEKNLRAGMSEREARRQALIAFGGVEQHKESVRDARTLGWVPGLTLDLRLGYRMLVKHPGLTLVGGLAIAFAIWLGATSFEFMRQVVRPTIPLEEGHRIVGIQNWHVSLNRPSKRQLHDLAAWRESVMSIEDLGAFRTTERNLRASGGTGAPVVGAEMSAAGFRVARVPPLLGRTLVEADERPGAPAVVVLGHEIWRTRFGGDSGIVGGTVHLGDDVATVVGVMPEGFAFPVAHDVWMPLRLDPLEHRRGGGPGIDVFGRLAPGAELRDAQTELATVGTRTATDFPHTNEHLRPKVTPFAEMIMGVSSLESVGLMSVNLLVVALLVLICGNVALLMFARAAARQNEIAMRSALGATRRRLVVQLFAEALVLAGVAAGVGLGAASLGLRWGFAMVESEVLDQGALPFWFEPALSPLTVAYALALTVIGAMIAGVVPALKVTRGLGTRLRQAGPGGGGFRFGGIWTGVIVTQVALTVAFPTAAFFLHRDITQLRSVEVGFAEDRYLSTRLELDGKSAPATYAAAHQELRRRLAADPAVRGVTYADRLPRMYHPYRLVEVDSGPAAAVDPRWSGYRVSSASVGVDFFDVLEAPLVAGRGFRAADSGSEAPVVVVNQSFVELVLGGRNPIGRRVRYTHLEEWDDPRPVDDEPWHEIVGVVADLGMSFGPDPKIAGFYHPAAIESVHPAYLAIHVAGEAASFAPALRAHAAAVDPALRLHEVVPIDQLSDAQITFLRTWLRLALVVSGLAMLLALAGIHAVMAFTVSQRTREIGIRVALGANAHRVVAAIFRRPLIQIGAGIGVGGLLTMALGYVARGAVTPSGTMLVLAHIVLVTAVCALACITPTRRALRVEPTEALRAE